MAEFQVVMKHTKRMCDSMESCDRCPMPRDDAEFTCPMCDCVGDAKEYERIVMDWAAKNPEPRYPTWNEWYKATFPNSNYHTIPCPSMFYKICETSNYHAEVECYECKNSPIPADVAEKLGIKPIGWDADA